MYGEADPAPVLTPLPGPAEDSAVCIYLLSFIFFEVKFKSTKTLNSLNPKLPKP